MKILLVDFSSEEGNFLADLFEADDYETVCSNYSTDLLDRLMSDYFGALLLNINLQREDISLRRIQSIRNESMIPIIVISENDENFKKILAFDYGADDYIIKPFDNTELRSRVRATVRRDCYYHKLKNQSGDIKIKDLYVDTLSRKVSYRKNPVNLTNMEYELFLNLINSPNKVFEREKLVEKVWGYSSYSDERTVDVHIRRIRKKFQEINPDASFICTKWGVGYYFDDKLI